MPDDLRKISGIGPATAATLKSDRITTFAKLANSDPRALAARYSGDERVWKRRVAQAAKLAKRNEAAAAKTAAARQNPAPKTATQVVRHFAKMFENPVPGAESGLYAPTIDEGEPFVIADGHYCVKGSAWTFSFKGGRLLQAVHAHRKALIPADVTEIAKG